MKTYKENLREYIRVIEMCEKYNKEHGTDVKPWSCVKYDGEAGFNAHMAFTGIYNRYTFAISILEAKPVFVGNRIWFKDAQLFISITEMINGNGITDDYCSWNSPKRETVIINGVWLPRPLKEQATNGKSFTYNGFTYSRETAHFHFNDYQEFRKWENYFETLLLEARDKED